jgi:2-polyprenyl-6-methoxyphenol hydroxylase-like FAD-dependent oxidoreductase
LEKIMHDLVNESGSSKVRVGCEVVKIEEDDDSVLARYVDKSGATTAVRGKFLAGADGKVGYTRKKYLEPKGVDLERIYEYVL